MRRELSACPQYDLQVILCTFDSMEDVLDNFDIDACRVAYDGRRLVGSETFIRAVTSGMVIARPQNDSANYALRLHKYATLPAHAPDAKSAGGYAIALADCDDARPGRTILELRETASPHSLPGPIGIRHRARRPSGDQLPHPMGRTLATQHVYREWEKEWDEIDTEMMGLRPFAQERTDFHGDHPDLGLDAAESEPAPEWPAAAMATIAVADAAHAAALAAAFAAIPPLVVPGLQDAGPKAQIAHLGYSLPPVKHMRQMREVATRQSLAYSNVHAREVVEVCAQLDSRISLTLGSSVSILQPPERLQASPCARLAPPTQRSSDRDLAPQGAGSAATRTHRRTRVTITSRSTTCGGTSSRCVSHTARAVA